MRPTRALSLAVLPVALVAASCRVGVRRLDEAVFHDGPGYRLKVVRYYENLPLHYTGEIYSVQCGSQETRGIEAHSVQDAGWRMLERAGAIGSNSAEDILPRLTGRYLAIDERRLVWVDRLFQVTFDACGTFASWDPTQLPAARIDPVEKPDYCRPKGAGDCRSMDFDGERMPRYVAIHVDRDGRVEFVVRTPAFHDAAELLVRSSDFGSTWTHEWRPEGSAGPSLRELNVEEWITQEFATIRPEDAAELEMTCGAHEKLLTVRGVAFGDLDGDGEEEALY